MGSGGGNGAKRGGVFVLTIITTYSDNYENMFDILNREFSIFL